MVPLTPVSTIATYTKTSVSTNKLQKEHNMALNQGWAIV